jgi:dinuclear metal center YbgI/SA1388 family protein
VAVLAAHTNLDRGRNGLNDWLAERLGLAACQPLALGAAGGLTKLVVFVPSGYEGQVAEALFAGGAGSVGGYDRCSFAATGFGTYRPGAGTEPFHGTVGVAARTAEVRLETIVPAESVNRALTRMLKVHPYEEVAYDLIPLGNRRGDVGLGRIGRLAAALPLADFVRQVEARLATRVRFCGDPQRPVAKVAVCGGSGASLLAEAERQGADVLVTGDVKYHEARSAEARGVALIDAGHFATERIVVPGLATVLRAAAGKRGLAIEFIEMSGEQDPFLLLPPLKEPSDTATAAAIAAGRGKQTGGKRAGRS